MELSRNVSPSSNPSIYSSQDEISYEDNDLESESISTFTDNYVVTSDNNVINEIGGATPISISTSSSCTACTTSTAPPVPIDTTNVVSDELNTTTATTASSFSGSLQSNILNNDDPSVVLESTSTTNEVDESEDIVSPGEASNPTSKKIERSYSTSVSNSIPISANARFPVYSSLEDSSSKSSNRSSESIISTSLPSQLPIDIFSISQTQPNGVGLNQVDVLGSIFPPLPAGVAKSDPFLPFHNSPSKKLVTSKSYVHHSNQRSKYSHEEVNRSVSTTSLPSSKRIVAVDKSLCTSNIPLYLEISFSNIPGAPSLEVESPIQWIIRSLLGEFCTRSDKKVDNILSKGLEFFSSNLVSHASSSLFSATTASSTDSLLLAVEADAEYFQILCSIGELGKSFLPIVYEVFLQWKANQKQWLVHPSAPELARLKIEESLEHTKLSLKEGILAVEELHQLAVDLLFIVGLRQILRYLGKKQANRLNDSFCSGLVSLLIDPFLRVPMSEKRSNFPQEIHNILTHSKKNVLDIYAQVIGELSRHKLRAISNHFFKELAIPISSSTARSRVLTSSLLHSMRYVTLKVNRTRAFAHANDLLGRFSEYFTRENLKKMDREIRLLLYECLFRILFGVVYDEFNQSVYYEEWCSKVDELFEVISKQTKKAKDFASAYPLMTALLCIGGQQNFLRLFWPFVESLLRPRDRVICGVCLDCLLPILNIYLKRYTDSPEITYQRLQIIATALFPAPKKSLFFQHENLESLTKIVSCIARCRIDFAMQNIVFEMLKSTDGLIPERIFVGLNSFKDIMATIVKSSISSSQSVKGEAKNRRHKSSSFSSQFVRGLVPGGIQPYMRNISIFLGKILVALDKTVLSNLQTSTLKSTSDSGDRKHINLELLLVVLDVIPIAYPQDCTHLELTSFLCKCLMHWDKAISDKSFETLELLVCTRPLIRTVIIKELFQYSLSFSSSRLKNVHSLLVRLSNLLKTWAVLLESNEARQSCAVSSLFDDKMKEKIVYLINLQLILADENNEQETEEINFQSMEAIALVHICSSRPGIRLCSIEVLQSIRRISPFFEESDHIGIHEHSSRISLPHTHVADIIDEAGPDIVQRLFQKDQFFTKFETAEEVGTSFVSIAGGSNRQEQLHWCYCVGELARHISFLCPKVSSLIWNLISSRVHAVQPDENVSKMQLLQRDQSNNFFCWRNYIMILCAIVQVGDTPEGQIDVISQKKKQTSSTKGILTKIVSIIRSSTVNFYLDACVMALQRCNPSCYTILFDLLRPIEQEAFFGSSRRFQGRRKRNRLRNTLTMIRSYIADNMIHGTVASNLDLCRMFVDYVQDMYSFFSQTSVVLAVDNLLNCRYNLCIVVRTLATEMIRCKTPEVFPVSLRRKFFYLFKDWSQAEELLDDGQIPLKKVNVEYMSQTLAKVYHLENAACSAISALLLGKILDEEEIKGPDNVVFQLVDKLLLRHRVYHGSSYSKGSIAKMLKYYARTALESFLKGNNENTDLFLATIRKCYSIKRILANGYFLGLVEYAKQGNPLNFPNFVTVLLNLILLKAGDNSVVVRQNAHQLLYLVAPFFNRNATNSYSVCPCSAESEMTETYSLWQLNLSSHLANLHPQYAVDFICEAFAWLELVEFSDQERILSYVIPWVDVIVLSHYPKNHSNDLLYKFLDVTFKFCKLHGILIERMWSALTNHQKNIDDAISFLIRCDMKRNFLEYLVIAKRVVIYIGRCAPQICVDALVGEISSTATPIHGRASTSTPSKLNTSGISDPNPGEFDLIQDVEGDDFAVGVTKGQISGQNSTSGDDPLLSTVHFSLILLSELAYESGNFFRSHIPVIMHLAFLGFDYPSLPVFDHCRVLLMNLLYSLIIGKPQTRHVNSEENEIFIQALEIYECLRTKENKIILKSFDKEENLSIFVNQILYVLSNSVPDLREKWGAEALIWALWCPEQKQNTRSCHIYRILAPAPSLESLSDVLESSIRHLLSSSIEGIKIAAELFKVLQVMVKQIHTSKLLLFPQVFWVTMGLLYTDCEEVYHIGLHLLAQLLDKLNFSDRAVQNVILASIPKRWGCSSSKFFFPGTQPLTVRGLRSIVTHDDAIGILRTIILCPCDQIFQPDANRFLVNLLTLMPWLLENFGDSDLINCVIEELQYAAESKSYSEVSRVLSNIVAKAYSSPESFINDIKQPLAELVSCDVVYVFTLLVSLIDVSGGYGVRVIEIIGSILPILTSSAAEVVKTRFSTLFYPMMYLISGPHWQEAIRVLKKTAEKRDSNNFNKHKVICLSPLPNPPSPEFTSNTSQGYEQMGIALQDVLKTFRGTASIQGFPNSSLKQKKIFGQFLFFKLSEKQATPDENAQLRHLIGGPLKDDEEIVQSDDQAVEFAEIRSKRDSMDLSHLGDIGIGQSQRQLGFPTFKGFDDLLKGIEKMSPTDALPIALPIDSSILENDTILSSEKTEAGKESFIRRARITDPCSKLCDSHRELFANKPSVLKDSVNHDAFGIFNLSSERVEEFRQKYLHLYCYYLSSLGSVKSFIGALNIDFMDDPLWLSLYKEADLAVKDYVDFRYKDMVKRNPGFKKKMKTMKKKCIIILDEQLKAFSKDETILQNVEKDLSEEDEEEEGKNEKSKKYAYQLHLAQSLCGLHFCLLNSIACNIKLQGLALELVDKSENERKLSSILENEIGKNRLLFETLSDKIVVLNLT